VTTLSPAVTTPPGTAKSAPMNPLKTKALRALDDLPPFSPIMNKVLASLAGEDASFTKLGDLVEKDTAIAGNLLHVVNSALYARRSTVNSVRHALSLLGLSKLRNVVLGMSVANMWNHSRLPATWSMKRFDMHSAAVAILSDLLAQHLPVAYPEGAFVAGLFHDLGRLLIALSLPQESAAIEQRFERGFAAGNAENSPVTLVQCEEKVLGFSHAELSADALAVWKLPWPVQAAVASHHADWSGEIIAEGPVSTGPAELPLGRLVDAANQYVNSTGDAISQDARMGASDPERIGMLGLEPDRLNRLLIEFRAEYVGMMQFFS
jgi:HD-like signal output (HDOD) protein